MCWSHRRLAVSGNGSPLSSGKMRGFAGPISTSETHFPADQQESVNSIGWISTALKAGTGPRHAVEDSAHVAFTLRCRTVDIGPRSSRLARDLPARAPVEGSDPGPSGHRSPQALVNAPVAPVPDG